MALFEKILVPIDGTRQASAGATLAIEIAKSYGAALAFVTVVDVASLAVTSDYAAIDAAATAQEVLDVARAMVEKAAAAARAEGLDATGTLSEGPTLDRLLDAIGELHATVVVMGSHGRGGLARALFGSTTEGLLRRSPIPVVVAPHISH